ncbi:acetyl-CoA C-acyltransferase family protein [Simiduia sp. 21SJ11W-1]|uniref:acetyl-CoA C-acyltransferase family protein n=1 Tax=Simiduia sp. 21SJ11W-1 TaxID=2909669 RepID=UPI0020A1D1C3|nr:acetyl-CoA C-acyltransferase family protein [Simiduia sp. 21SJ11W-1]UTA49116.1 acetyl-CoA C-acyltransferase family protein [Simiduia sp. 21SJ11W-1]
MSQREVVVLSGVRTPIGTFGGSLKDIAPTELAGQVVAEAVKRAGIAPEAVGHCVIGNVTHSDRKDMYMSRVAGIKGGLPETTPAVTVNRLCGSGLQALVSASQLILLGDCDAAVTGGAESMSRVPYWLPQARFGARMGDAAMVDAMTGALTCPINDVHMGITAENVAEKWGISREDQDALAVESHQRAARATEEGRFKDQILPIELKTRKGTVTFAHDEHVRADASLEGMAKLRPVFKKDGTVTAGNASGLNDAAAAMVLMERAEAEKQGLKPMARLVGYSFAGVEPKYMGIGPVPAVKKLLATHNLTVADIDVWEVNEAFAAQAIAVARDLEIPADKLNPNGSGISLGHPIGATGAVITVKALYELQRTQSRYAVVTMCIGGGQGIAALFERM